MYQVIAYFIPPFEIQLFISLSLSLLPIQYSYSLLTTFMYTHTHTQEYSAVTKIQSIFRRHLILQELEDEGLSTSYIRNRKRQRKATPMGFHSSNVVDEATPDLGFGCCSIGLAFGGDHESDEGGE